MFLAKITNVHVYHVLVMIFCTINAYIRTCLHPWTDYERKNYCSALTLKKKNQRKNGGVVFCYACQFLLLLTAKGCLMFFFFLLSLLSSSLLFPKDETKSLDNFFEAPPPSLSHGMDVLALPRRRKGRRDERKYINSTCLFI